MTCSRWIAGLLLTASLSWGQAGAKLDFSEPVKLISCEPASTVPCFRAKLNVVDAKGDPMGVELPKPERLAAEMTVHVGDQEVKPFYAVAGGASTAKVRGRAALVIVDISGSMNKKLASGLTRFETAKQAISIFLQGFERGADRVAVVPFESHNVQSRIAGALFARTKEEALAQVDALPYPEERNNTALYSAEEFGIQTMQAALPQMQSEATDGLETMVIVLTDGKNEVFRGDDLGLLAGLAGEDEAATTVKTSGISLIAIGFGDASGLDEAALRRTSTRYYLASDLEGLKRIFAFTRTLLNNRILAAFSSPLPDRASLAGQTLPITMELRLPDGKVIRSSVQNWTAPQMGVPVYAAKASAEELKAVLTAQPEQNGWVSILRPVGVFCGLGLLLILLWFWVPRLIWPEQFIGVLPGAGQAKWGNQTRIVDGVIAGRPAPPGFQAGPKGVNMPPRAPSQATVMNPHGFVDPGQTRLGNREGSPRRD